MKKAINLRAKQTLDDSDSTFSDITDVLFEDRDEKFKEAVKVML